MFSVYVPKWWHIFLPIIDAYSFWTTKTLAIFFPEKFVVPHATIFRRLHYYFPGSFLKKIQKMENPKETNNPYLRCLEANLVPIWIFLLSARYKSYMRLYYIFWHYSLCIHLYVQEYSNLEKCCCSFFSICI